MKSRTILKYPGSKFRISSWIVSHFPEHKIYAELFGGSAAVLFQKRPAVTEIYNDVDNDVFNFFTVLRDPDKKELLKEAIYYTSYSRKEHEESWKPGIDDVDRARKFIIRSIFNIAKGPFKKSGFDSRINDDFICSRQRSLNAIPDILDYYSDRLRSVICENKDYYPLLQQFDRPETLFYLDPIYLETTAVYGRKFTFEDHQLLCERIKKVKGMIIISGYESVLYREELEDAGWLKRRSKSRTDNAHHRVECIWLNPAAQKKQPEPTLFEQPITP